VLPVNRRGESFVRPHDLEIQVEPNGSTVEAIVERVVHLGFEVRVDLVLEDSFEASAQLTRDDVEALEQRPGEIVFARPTRSTVFNAVATPPGLP
jgi:sulfate/thiosulfate transport system ATP-binding protein